jgi:hypothetical protein
MPYNEEFNQEYSKRVLRGAQMIEEGIEPKQLTQNSFEIPSQRKDFNYIVTSYANSWSCNCPDYQYRHVTCKHIHCIILWQKLSKKLSSEPLGNAIVQNSHLEEMICKFCRSPDVIKYGKKNGRQNFMCKSCAESSFSLGMEILLI